MSKQYAWEDEKYTEKLIRELRGSNPPKKRGPYVLPLTLCALCYVLLLLRTSIVPLFFIGSIEPVAAQLEAELYGNFAFYALLFLPPIICLLFYINAIVIVPMRERAELMRPSDSPDKEERRRKYLEQYRLYTERESIRWQTHAFYYILFAAELALVAQGVFFSRAWRETALLYSDLDQLRAGKVSVYEGKPRRVSLIAIVVDKEKRRVASYLIEKL